MLLVTFALTRMFQLQLMRSALGFNTPTVLGEEEEEEEEDDALSSSAGASTAFWLSTAAASSFRFCLLLLFFRMPNLIGSGCAFRNLEGREPISTATIPLVSF